MFALLGDQVSGRLQRHHRRRGHRATRADAKIRWKRSLFGNILQPDECWILNTRLPTVQLRMNRQSKNAQRIAEKLASHPGVEHVYYPTLFEDAEQIRDLSRAVRFSGRHDFARHKGRQEGRVRFSAQSEHRREMRCRWAAWKRWSVIRGPRRIPAGREQELEKAGIGEGWFGSRWELKTGAIC